MYISKRVCISHTRTHTHIQKRCILINPPRPFKGSNPPGCDFPPLVLRGWWDWGGLGQLSLLRWQNNASVSPVSFSLLLAPSSPWHSLTFWWRVDLEPPGRVTIVNLLPYGVGSFSLSVMEEGRQSAWCDAAAHPFKALAGRFQKAPQVRHIC